MSRHSVFTYRLSQEKRRLLEDRATMVYLFQVHLYAVVIGRLIGVSAPTVGRARVLHEIPIFPRILLPPDWGDVLTEERWQTIKFRVYAAKGRCPLDCPALLPCEDRWWDGEGAPGEMLPDCPVRFYFSNPPALEGDMCDITLTTLDNAG